MAGDDQEVDLEDVVAARDLDVVQQQPVVGRVVAQMGDHAALGIVDRAPASDDLCHGDHLRMFWIDNMLSK
ncbi:hypothetical protein GCM10022248_16240 [Nonomuraea soli]